MIYCPECENRCSAAASTCPQCGHPLMPRASTPVSAPTAPPPQIQQVVMQSPAWSAGVAAVLSFIIPGLGQLYKGQLFNGLAWFCVVVAAYMLFIIPGLFMHLFCVVGALSGDPYRRGHRSFRMT